MMIWGLGFIVTFWDDDGIRGVVCVLSDKVFAVVIFIDVVCVSPHFVVFVFEELGLILKGKKSLTWDSIAISFGSLFFVCRLALLRDFCLVWKNIAISLYSVH